MSDAPAVVDLPWDSRDEWPVAPRPPEELPRRHRPRAKLFLRGPRALSRAELFTILLGCRAEVARARARRHTLARMTEMSVDEWAGEPGIGSALAARLSAALELGRRAHARDAHDRRPRLTGPRDAYRVVRDLGRARKEHLVGLYLDSQNGLLHRETVSVGSLNTTRTHPREILYPAVTHLALGFILAHNHPSGCTEPSEEDVEFTRSVRRASDLMGIELYDHLIVTRHGFTSLRERGLL